MHQASGYGFNFGPGPLISPRGIGEFGLGKWQLSFGHINS